MHYFLHDLHFIIFMFTFYCLILFSVHFTFNFSRFTVFTPFYRSLHFSRFTFHLLPSSDSIHKRLLYPAEHDYAGK